MDASNQGQEGEKLPRHPDTLEVSSDSFGSFYSPPVPEATVPPTILDSFGSFGSFQGVEGAGQQEELHEAGSMDKIDLTARTGEDPSISPDVESFVEESRNNGLLEGTVGSMQTLSLDPSASLASRDDATPSASVPPTNATAPEGANLARRLSVTSSISSGSCRVSVSMPVMDSNAENLPTRAWTDPNLFLDIAAQDPVDTALNKAFPYQEFMSLPKRSLMTVEEALSMDGDPFVTLVKANSWVALANLAK